jgi:3-methyladenine DNA glycosylase/8-oxoguanine DNA glycosylase
MEKTFTGRNAKSPETPCPVGHFRLARKDELLAPLVKHFPGLKLASGPTVFESLVMGVLSQQVNLTFAYSIKRELVETFGRKWKANGETHYAFPEPERFTAMRNFDLNEWTFSLSCKLDFLFMERFTLSGDFLHKFFKSGMLKGV